MTKKQNFIGQAIPSIIDTEYCDCNFAMPEAIEAGGQWLGVRLFPGDDTPRTFIRCNLVNREPPPGSTVIDCNCAIIRPKVLLSTEDIIVDGQVVGQVGTYQRICYGKWAPAGYFRFPSPKITEFKEAI